MIILTTLGNLQLDHNFLMHSTGLLGMLLTVIEGENTIVMLSDLVNFWFFFLGVQWLTDVN